MNERVVRIAKIVAPVVIALLSLFVLARFAASTEFHAATIEALDEKQTTVAELTAASTAASTAISLIPGDAGTPIADKLADFSSYFLIVFSAIFLEKYLLTVTGYAAFKILIPIGCALFLAGVYWKKESLNRIAVKLAVFGLVIALVIPTSVKVSDMIEKTYQDSIHQTIETATDSSTYMDEESTEAEGEKEGMIPSVISGIKTAASSAVEKAEQVLNSFIEALAVMLVTTCVIPILVILAFIWISKIFLSSSAPVPQKVKDEGNS